MRELSCLGGDLGAAVPKVAGSEGGRAPACDLSGTSSATLWSAASTGSNAAVRWATRFDALAVGNEATVHLAATRKK